MSDLDSVQPDLWPILAAMIGAVAVSSVVRLVTVRRVDAETRATRLSSLRIWWILTLAFVAALLLGRVGICGLFATATAMAMHEYLKLVDSPRGLPELVVLGGLVFTAYGLMLAGQTSLFFFGFPVAALVVVAILTLARGGTRGFLRRTTALYRGVICLIWGVAHVATYYSTVPFDAGAAGPAGWVILVVFLTEINDISQAVTGRFFAGRQGHLITPRVSPAKTWEGLLGGIVFTTVLSVLLTPLLTDLDAGAMRPASSAFSPWLLALALGLLIAVGGFLGDINISAVKRRAAAKDAGRLLGGMGGVLDRIDSLSVTAPLAAWLILWARP